jgi:hypothetical protein
MVRALLAACAGLAAFAAFDAAGSAGSGASLAPPNTASAPAPLELSRLLGFAGAKLVGVDPESLAPLSGAGIAVGSGGCAPRQDGNACWSVPPWSASPDGKRLAVARNDASSVRLVDVGRMRVTANVRVDGGAIGALAWLTRDRMLAVQEQPGERQRLLGIDLVKRRVATRQALSGSVQRLARTAHELVLLLAPAQAIGPARVAVATGRGDVRFVSLARILAGSQLLGTGSNHRVDARLPGLAVDSDRRRAFVVADSTIAEIDLRSSAVEYHTLDGRPSFLARLWSWLEPAASAKVLNGYARDVRWLGGNLLAFSGSDTEQSTTRPAGLVVVDTRDWSVQNLDRGATGFDAAGDVLLATGAQWDAAKQRTVGIGLAAYGFDGGKRFQLFDGEAAWLAQVHGGRAYVGTSGQAALRVVDLATGAVVATRQQALPWLLLGAGASWWGG